ncbi:MAG: rhomboid family intramembrane serine protease [Betaproteobacteria bacterium]
MAIVLVLAVIGAVAYGALTPDERLRILRATVRTIQWLTEYGRQELAPYREALRARTPFALVTPAIVIVNVVVFAGMLFGAGSRSDPATILSWGASFGPRTTNGEWWRLMTATFVHPSFIVLLVNIAAIVQVGFVVERLVGPLAFASAYVAAGTLVSLVSLWWFPLRVVAGASGAVSTLYGLLLSTAALCWWRDADLTLPIVALKRIAPGAAAFLLCVLADGSAPGAGASLVGLLAGLLFGFAVAKDVDRHAPAWRPTAAALGTASTLVLVGAILLRGILDVRPELQRLVAIEHRTAEAYETASAQFRKGKMTILQLADLIERSIIPQLQAEETRINGLRGVPREDAPLVADARQYLQLRSQSWRLRATGLRAEGTPVNASSVGRGSNVTFREWAEARHHSTQRTLGKAEEAERASLQALDRLSQ